MLLSEIQSQSERLISELKWSEQEVADFVQQVNRAITRAAAVGNNELDYSLVTHPATYSGGFILFGGWTKIYDQVIPSGTRGHELYLEFGGLGAGGWSGDCDIELLCEGSVTHDGKSYAVPINHNGGDDWEGYQTAFTWFHDHVKSFMFMYLPVFAQPIPVFVYFDKESNSIGVSVPSVSLSCGVGGGNVKVKS